MANKLFVIRYRRKIKTNGVKKARFDSISEGWAEYYCMGAAEARSQKAALVACHGEANVFCEPFTDRVQNVYKRRKDFYPRWRSSQDSDNDE